MTSRTSVSADIEQRFGYKESGTFRCAYGNEKPLLIILAAVTVVLAAAVLWGISRLIESVTAVFFYAILLVIAETVVLFAASCLAKLILYGKECFYHADEGKLSIDSAGKFEDFFYTNVMCVRYDPLVTLGRQRGFIVSITTRKSTVTYKYIFGRTKVVMSPDKTPFAILEERAGLRQLREQQSNPMPARTAPQPIDVTVAEEPIAAPVAEEASAGGSNILGRAATADMKISHVSSEAQELTAKGTFRVPSRYEIPLFFACLVLTVAAVADAVADIARAEGALSDLAPLAIIIYLLGSVAVFRIFHRTEYSYTADSREFIIKDKHGSETVIYFCDVERVEYAPYRFLWKQRGYIVSIVMKYTTVSYKYLFPYRGKRPEPEDTPFHHIERMVSGEYGSISWKR